MAMAAKILLIVAGVVGTLGGLAQIGQGDGNGAVYLIAAVLAFGGLLYLSQAESE